MEESRSSGLAKKPAALQHMDTSSREMGLAPVDRGEPGAVLTFGTQINDSAKAQDERGQFPGRSLLC